MRPTLFVLTILAAPFVLTAQTGLSDAQKKTISDINAASALSAETIQNANKLKDATAVLTSHLQALPDPPSSTTQALQILDGLDPLVRDAIANQMVAQLASQSTALEDQKKNVDVLKASLGDTSSTAFQEIQDAAATCTKVSANLDASQQSVRSASTALNTALAKAYAFFISSFTLLDTSIKPLTDLASNESNVETIRQTLADQASNYALQCVTYQKLKALWDGFSIRLAALVGNNDQAAGVTTKANSASADLNAILPKFKSWFDALNASTVSTANAANATASALSVDYARTYDDAVSKNNDGRALKASLITILRSWDAIHTCIPVPPPAGFSLNDTDKSADALRKTNLDLAAALLKIEDTLSGNRQGWVADQVRLYYFTDVPRLMEILNPNVAPEGGISVAADKAAAARKDLMTADLSLADARAEINKYQRQVLVLQEELRQAQAEQKAKNVLFTKTSNLVNRLTGRQNAAKTKADASKGDLNSPDPLKKAAAEKDQSNLDSTTAQLNEAQRTNDNAQKDRDAAQQGLDTAQDAQQGLPAKIAAAKQSLDDAQTTVNKLQNAALIAAQDASDALAAARDHTPHLKSTPIGTSTDPAHRVELFGFTDSKSIFIRGSKPDVEAVKELIAQFDQPSPQARITLWSLQLNSAGEPNNNDATKRFNKALGIVEQDLSTTRGWVAASLSLLRETVGKYVNQCASAPYSQANFSEDTLRVRRLKCFYEGEVLWRLAGDPWDDSTEKAFARVSRYTLPDPASVTTLGEALMVLSLARNEFRDEILKDFRDHLGSSLENLKLTDAADDDKTALRLMQKDKYHFVLMEHFLNFDASPPSNGQSNTDVQKLEAEIQNTKRHIERDESRLSELERTIAKTQASGQAQELSEEVRKLQIEIQNAKDRITRNESQLADPAHTQASGQAQPSNEVERSLRIEVQNAKDNIKNDELRLAELEKTIGTIQSQTQQLGQDKLDLQSEIQNAKDRIAKHDARLQKLETLPHPPSGTVQSEISSRQSELIYALQSSSLKNIQQAVAFFSAQLRQVALDSQATNLRLTAMLALPSAQQDQARIRLWQFQLTKLNAAQMTISSRLAPLILYCYEKYGIPLGNSEEFKKAIDATPRMDATRLPLETKRAAQLAGIERATAAPGGDASAVQLGESLATLDPLRRATPRVAAADEMLKELMIAVEDDLDRLFIHPMLERLRNDLTGMKDLQVGVLQRTSVLATNRLVASVDPRASAQLSVGSETDILQSLLQLGEVFVAAKTGGVNGALNTLNAQKREAPPEVYSLNTGSQFKVTPIFDPSGQALRFQFDYVANTQIQEPNGTTNTQLPRIERHNVNTEVQISNMEMREISRFEANSKIGIPDTFWGGVPIIKDIPIIKDHPKVRAWFPLLGWFVRKRGEAAASQESIIFGQTTIYPTIADIVNLLTSTESKPELPESKE